MEIIKTAKALLKKGYSVIPVTKNKIPAIAQWYTYQTTPMKEEDVDGFFKGAKNLALLTGTQMGVFCIDIDLKYDLSGTLFDRLKEMIPKELLKKAYVQKTQSGGYHLVYRASPTILKGNEKWASRHTTAYEQHQTYMHNFQREDTRDKALKIASSDRVRVLLETRAIGGYFLIPPSQNYEHVFGKITLISPEEYEILETVCRSFNEVFVQEKKQYSGSGNWKITPFEDYRERCDVIELLESHGWEIAVERGDEYRFKRPGNTSTKDSAIFHNDTKVFNCFTTSTVFDTSKAYTPAMIFAELECKGDLSEAFYKLVELGYGEREL